MGFKADLSFLSKVTMGATAARAAMAYLKEIGFVPLELERPSSSNKIWSTKVKRFRLPDVLCARTGLRVEVRGKSDLKLKMSDSPNNPERAWDATLRGEDLVALVACRDDGGGRIHVRGRPVFFAVNEMRETVGTTTLGPPKAASEGAERDRTWPCIVPTADGTVVEVADGRLAVLKDGGRRHTYRLASRGHPVHAYVRPGERFVAETSILAGTVAKQADLAPYLARVWNPADDIASLEPTDRYAAAKALAVRDDIPNARELLRGRLAVEDDRRTALEIAAALSRLGANDGLAYLRTAAIAPPEGAADYLKMEAVLIMSELGSASAATVLDEIASAEQFQGDELRQAAVWGLGKRGCKTYERLLPYLRDADDAVNMHAVAAFGQDVPGPVVAQLVAVLCSTADDRAKASTSEALRLIASDEVVSQLVRVPPNPWILATLGRLPAARLLAANLEPAIAQAIAPVQKTYEETNWLARRGSATDFHYLVQQDL